MTAGVMWRLCGFCGAKSTAKKTRGLLSLEWDESKELGVIKGDYSITVGQLGINDGA